MKDLLWSLIDRFSLGMKGRYEFLLSSEKWDLGRLKKYQLGRVRKVARSFGLRINSWEDFYRQPLRTKEDLRDFKPKKGKYRTHNTSGS